MTIGAVTDVDLTDVEVFVRGEAHHLWRRLRGEAPVHWNPTSPGEGFWALTTHADVVAAYRDPETFSSAHGAILGGSYRNRVDTSSNRMLVSADPPHHGQLRKRTQQVLLRRMIERISHDVRITVGAALDRLWADGGGDFARDVAPELPVGALMALLSVGRAEAVHLVGLTRSMIGFRDPEHRGNIPNEALRLAAAQAEIFEFFAELIAERRARPGDDAVSILIASEGRRDPGDETLLFNLMNLAVGGNETTPHSASGGVLALMERPEQWDTLVRNPSVVPTAIEEILRWTSTNAYVQRVVTRPVRVRDVEFSVGDVVTLWNASANRDEVVFAEPDRFDVTRSPNPHLAFGIGIHRCIGAAAARGELKALLAALRSREGRLTPAGEVVRLRSNFMLGINRMPVGVVAP